MLSYLTRFWVYRPWWPVPASTTWTSCDNRGVKNAKKHATIEWVRWRINLSLSYPSFKAIASCPQDSSSSRTARQHTQRATPHCAQNWLRASCPDIITKDHWPPNSSNVNPMDYHVWGAMLEVYCKLKTKLKTNAKPSRKHFRLSGATCHRDRSTRL